MRRTLLAVLTAVSLGAALAGSVSAFAQESEAVQSQGRVFGFQDARTGAFHPLNRGVPDVTVTPTTGSVTATMTIKLSTAYPAGFKIVCSSVVAATSVNLGLGTVVGFDETASTVATVSGTTATCTVKIPYSWTLPASSATVTNAVNGTYSVEVFTAASALPGLLRSSSGTFLSLTKLPAVGTATNVAVNVTL